MPATAAWLASAEALLNRCIGESTQARALAREVVGVVQRDLQPVRAARHEELPQPGEAIGQLIQRQLVFLHPR